MTFHDQPKEPEWAQCSARCGRWVHESDNDDHCADCREREADVECPECGDPLGDRHSDCATCQEVKQ